MKKSIFAITGVALLMRLFCGNVGQSTFTNDVITREMENVAVVQTEDIDLHLQAKSCYLMDTATQSVIYQYNEEKCLPIASMCKIMTLTLVFETIEKGDLQLDEKICISERAASMGGSQVFLEANGRYGVGELIKSIVICSANDSCVALAERIAGNETFFVNKMNEKAKELGADNTLFANCTGLPKEPQYSCAKDVAIMLNNLLQYDVYYQYGNVWMDKFMHPEGRYTEITNTNKLIRFYDGCDGGKTGFTNEAGFCLAATAKRDNMRIVGVVIGEETSANRFDDVRTMFDYAFANYTVTPIVDAEKALDQTATVLGGKKKSVSLYAERTLYDFHKRGEQSNCQIQFVMQDLRAPIKQREQIGEIILFKDGIECSRTSLLSGENVKRANLFDRIKDIANGWNAR